MHPNAAFRWEDRDALRAFAEEVGFGMLFAQTPDGPRVAHLPFVFTGPATLAFHLARGNALERHLGGAEALLVVNGPDGYVSPDWYASSGQVPTWNYLALELQGPVRKLTRDELIAQIDALSAKQEARLLPKQPWSRDKMPDGQFDKMLSAITGFEVDATAWRSTAKLGQHKSAEDREAAASGVETAGNRALAHLMRTLIK